MTTAYEMLLRGLLLVCYCSDPGAAAKLVTQLRRTRTSFLNKKRKVQEESALPPDFYAWNTPPPPAPPPGPFPSVFWIKEPPFFMPLPPLWQSCFGCDCLTVVPDALVAGGKIKNEFTCLGGKGTNKVPHLSWHGIPPINSGGGHPVLHKGILACPDALSFAVVVEDLDYPNGIGESTNVVHSHFWAVNIPGSWGHIDESALTAVSDRDPNYKLVFIGKNAQGNREMEPICPQKGQHRYRTTVWALKDYIGTPDNPLDPDTPYSAILPQLEMLELARVQVYGNVLSAP